VLKLGSRFAPGIDTKEIAEGDEPVTELGRIEAEHLEMRA
jgi:hypothetical protein